MYFTAKTLDDLMRPVLQRLLRSKNRVHASRGPTTELTGALLKIRNPRARLSRSVTKGKVFSCIGELLWYLSKGNELPFISYYLSAYANESDDGKTVFGGYGPRLFSTRGHNQVENVLKTLRASPSSRRAVIQLFDAGDIAHRKVEIPCTCTLQFLIRHGCLEMFTSMRSNDAFKGLPHDVFAFTMLQEIVARTLGLEPGSYRHAVGSLHLYESDFSRANRYLAEGWQSTIPMPPMPLGDPWQEIGHLLQLEVAIRSGKRIKEGELTRPGYWGDIVRLLQIFKLSKLKRGPEVARVKRSMTSKVFNTYIQRKETSRPDAAQLLQMDIPFSPSSTDAADN